MDTRELNTWEARLSRVAAGFPYPATPDLSRRPAVVIPGPSSARAAAPARMPRLALALALLLIIVATLLLVPPVRAQILEWLQIGGVRIFLVPPTPTPAATTPSLSILAPSTLTPSTATPAAKGEATAAPTPFINLAGPTTLDEARKRVDFDIRLPTYPPGLGPPDQVFLLDPRDGFLILTWLQPEQPSKIALALHIFASTSWAGEKWVPSRVVETQVNGQPAAWTTGPYLVKMTNGDFHMEELVEGHILIWEEDGITYRLETDAPMDEAIKIAESVR